MSTPTSNTFKQDGEVRVKTYARILTATEDNLQQSRNKRQTVQEGVY